MSIPENLKDKYFFHFTHLENLESIILNGLLCTNTKKKAGIKHNNLASATIQERRSGMKVSCGPKGTIHDYVPFYLCSVNPMFLSLVNSKNIDQQFVVFFAISLSYVEKENVVFTDASANTSVPPNYYDTPEVLEKLNWQAINTKTWGRGNDDDMLHKRMAEVLVHESFPVTDIDYIVVWNESVKKEVIELFKKHSIPCPKIEYSPLKQTYNFHFTKFMFGRGDESLVTGPFWLKEAFKQTIDYLLEKKQEGQQFNYQNISELLKAIEANFCAIPELSGIFKLETLNEIHSENVSDHTLKVVEKLINSECYKKFTNEDKEILKLSAYLHDIGKGPKSKWKNGKQNAYPDHPADALPMLKRILTEEVKFLSKKEARSICLLVAYHDLIGEIIGKGRDIQQLFNIIEDERELEMLSCLNRADVAAIDISLSMNYGFKIEGIKKQVIEKLNSND